MNLCFLLSNASISLQLYQNAPCSLTMHEPLLRLFSSKGEEAHSPPTTQTTHNEQCLHDHVLAAPSLSQSTSPYINLIENLSIKKRKIAHRSRSAPAVLFADAGIDFHESSEPRSIQNSSNLMVRVSLISVFLYLAIGVAVYMINESFEGTTTLKPIDAIYFTVVTLSTIGFGDIVPDAASTKIFTCGFILVGFGLTGFLLSGLVEYICDTQEAFTLSLMDENRYKRILWTYIVDEEKGRMRIRTKVSLALVVVIGCIAIGAVTAHFLEGMDWIDSFYLSITSVTTVGYGDYSFKTVTGRCFAIIWLLVSTLAVARAFLYLTDYSMHKRKRKVAKLVLHKKITMSDLVAADLDNDGSISKSEFVIYKLKQMGKITETDILQISKEFDSLGCGMYGKISVADLMENV